MLKSKKVSGFVETHSGDNPEERNVETGRQNRQ